MAMVDSFYVADEDDSLWIEDIPLRPEDDSVDCRSSHDNGYCASDLLGTNKHEIREGSGVVREPSIHSRCNSLDSSSSETTRKSRARKKKRKSERKEKIKLNDFLEKSWERNSVADNEELDNEDENDSDDDERKTQHYGKLSSYLERPKSRAESTGNDGAKTKRSRSRESGSCSKSKQSKDSGNCSNTKLTRNGSVSSKSRSSRKSKSKRPSQHDQKHYEALLNMGNISRLARSKKSLDDDSSAVEETELKQSKSDHGMSAVNPKKCRKRAQSMDVEYSRNRSRVGARDRSLNRKGRQKGKMTEKSKTGKAGSTLSTTLGKPTPYHGVTGDHHHEDTSVTESMTLSVLNAKSVASCKGRNGYVSTAEMSLTMSMLKGHQSTANNYLPDMYNHHSLPTQPSKPKLEHELKQLASSLSNFYVPSKAQSASNSKSAGIKRVASVESIQQFDLSFKVLPTNGLKRSISDESLITFSTASRTAKLFAKRGELPEANSQASVVKENKKPTSPNNNTTTTSKIRIRPMRGLTRSASCDSVLQSPSKTTAAKIAKKVSEKMATAAKSAPKAPVIKGGERSWTDQRPSKSIPHGTSKSEKRRRATLRRISSDQSMNSSASDEKAIHKLLPNKLLPNKGVEVILNKSFDTAFDVQSMNLEKMLHQRRPSLDSRGSQGSQDSRMSRRTSMSGATPKSKIRAMNNSSKLLASVGSPSG